MLVSQGVEEPSGCLLWPEKLNRCLGLGGFRESDPNVLAPYLL